MFWAELFGAAVGGLGVALVVLEVEFMVLFGAAVVAAFAAGGDPFLAGRRDEACDPLCAQPLAPRAGLSPLDRALCT